MRIHRQTARQADEVDVIETSREAGRPPTVGTCELACVVLKPLAKYHPGATFITLLSSRGVSCLSSLAGDRF